jgi:hypothetical protein
MECNPEANLERRILHIKNNLQMEAYTIAAKESVCIIEQALRELFRRHLTNLQEQDRIVHAFVGLDDFFSLTHLLAAILVEPNPKRARAILTETLRCLYVATRITEGWCRPIFIGHFGVCLY